MPRLKLKSIKVRNWGMIHGTELSFPEKGVVLVVGSNFQDSGGKFQSVGSGKTLLGEAISRALVGVSGRFTNLGHYASDKRKNKDMYVSVETTIDDKPLVVEMGYKCEELSKSGEGFRFTYNGESPVERSHLKDTRIELENILKITPELAEWTVFIDGDKLKFNRLSEKHAVELLMSALSQPPWTQYHENSKRILSGFKRQLGDAEANHQEAKNGVTKSKDSLQEAETVLARAEREYKEAREKADETIAGIRKKIDELSKKEATANSEIAKLKKEMKQIEDDGAEEYKRLDHKRLHLKSSVAEIQREKEKLIEKRSTLKGKFDQLDTLLEEMQAEPDNCPKCSKPWDKKHSKDELKNTREKCREAEEAYNKACDAVKDCNKRLQDEQDKYNDADDAVRNLNIESRVKAVRRKVEAQEDLKDGYNKKAREYEAEIAEVEKGPSKTPVDRAQAVIEERQRGVKAAQNRVEDTAQALSEAEQAVAVIQYWNEAYGPTGIPNMILRDTVQPLNDISRRLSNLMTGGTIQIGYDTTRELLSGKEKAELVIKVDNKLGSKRLEGSSKGEGGLTNLIVAETLSEVGAVSSRIGYRWYDEVVNSQDPVVRRNIFSYLKELAHRLGILVFIVDHHQEAANYADHILVAEKTSDGTTFHWA